MSKLKSTQNRNFTFQNNKFEFHHYAFLWLGIPPFTTFFWSLRFAHAYILRMKDRKKKKKETKNKWKKERKENRKTEMRKLWQGPRLVDLLRNESRNRFNNSRLIINISTFQAIDNDYEQIKSLEKFVFKCLYFIYLKIYFLDVISIDCIKLY